MKNSNRNLFFLFMSFLFLQACQSDDNVAIEEEPLVEVNNGYANVPEPLWSYFEDFELEALSRGVAINISNITAEISEIDQEHVAGTCTYGTNHPGHIVIDLAFWNQASTILKEMIIFHELGHCVLHRDHREGAYSNGACLSIMRSGLGECIDNYRGATRSVYLDELFGIGV